MIDCLSSVGTRRLEEIVRERALLVFDFDGTLAAIVDDPAIAHLRDSTRTLLRAAALLYPCAVLSGRARADLMRRLLGVPLVAVVGNHGAETRADTPGRAMRVRVRAWAAALREAVDGSGIRVEEKGLSVSLHYRGAASREEALRTIRLLATALPAAKVFGGDEVVNIVPAEVGTHRAAIEVLVREHGGNAVYVGREEDAIGSPALALAVRVGCSPSAAGYCLKGQEDIDELLWQVVAARARIAGPGEHWDEIRVALEMGVGRGGRGR